MRAHLRNACYGFVDYAAYPLTFLAAAPVLLRHLGPSEYGIFAFSIATVNAASILSSGFGDANIQQIATARARCDQNAIQQTIRCTVGIQLMLGTSVALLGLMLSSQLAARVTFAEPKEFQTCIVVLRVACLLVLLRTLETIAVSTQRAFDSYDEAVRVSAACRAGSLIVAGLLARRGCSLVAIVLAMGLFSMIGTAAQLLRVARRTSFLTLVPRLHGQHVRALAAFGGFTWLQAAGGVVAGQVDRLIVGVSMGGVAVAAYSFAAQLAQPIAGSTASGLHFLFPHLAHRVSHAGVSAARRPVAWAIACNVLIVGIETAPLLVFGHWALQKWAGDQIADANRRVLPLLAIASALTGLSVTGNYALLALGRVRVATWITLGSSAVMLGVAAMFTPKFGAVGMSLARVVCGATSLLVYIPLWRQLKPIEGRANSGAPAATVVERGACL